MIRTVTVLVIACPHALGLAIPLVIASYSAGYLYSYNAAYPWYASFVALLLCTMVAVRYLRDPSEAEV